MHRFPLLASSLALLAAFLLAGPTLSAVQSGITNAEKRVGALDTNQSNGRIAFVRLDQGFLGDIWVMDADGANETNLTNTPDVNERQPAWSPDGTKIAFTGPGPIKDGEGGLDEIWVMDADGANRTNLTNTLEFPDSQPGWAPSGTQLAFVREVPGSVISEQSDLFVMDANGENATNLTETDGNERDPAWSPDGAKIAFAGVRDGGEEILTMDSDGGNEEILTGDGADAFDRAPDWSPDGTMLAFNKQSQVGGCCEPWEIWAVNRDGSGDTNLTNHPAVDTAPSWSPDGTTITFASDRNSESDIYTMPAPTALPPRGETASVTTSQESGVMSLAAGYMLPRAASASTTSETTVRRLTKGGSASAPDWGKKNAGAKNTAPTITALRPAKNSSTTDRTPLVGATVTDAQTNLAKEDLTLVLDGTKIPESQFAYDRDPDRLRYTPATNLSLGRHTVKVVAQDPQGLVERKVWSFSVR